MKHHLLVCIRVVKMMVTTFFMLAMLFVSYFIPKWREQVNEKLKAVLSGATLTEKEDNYKDSIFTLACIKSICKSNLYDCFRRARYMGKAPDADSVTLNGKRKRLLSFQNHGRPLIVNFGSCTWPPFVVKLDRFKSLIGRFSKVADFIIVYVEEAHPADGWRFGGNFEIHKVNIDLWMKG